MTIRHRAPRRKGTKGSTTLPRAVGTTTRVDAVVAGWLESRRLAEVRASIVTIA
jgi:hypothetical protein